jgi:c-di-GMP-binding flagellar brake protein YcgR
MDVMDNVETDRKTDLEKNVRIIQEACDRNIPLELHYVNTNMSAQRYESDVLYAQTRLLGVDDQKIYLDSPQSIGKIVHLRLGWKVHAFFTIQKTLYSFDSTVTDLRCMVVLNREKTVVGMCMATPAKIRAGQRREDHRISLLGQMLVKVHIHETIKDNPNACPIGAKRFQAQGVNISRGGMSVRMEGEERFLLRFGQWYFLSFTFPTEPDPFLFLVELRCIRDVEKSESRRFGFQFLRWPDPIRTREKQARLGRILATLERTSLRKNKDTVAELFAAKKK